jgi:hypothetical protein
MDKNAKKELPSFLKNRKKVSEILNSWYKCVMCNFGKARNPDF